MSFLHSPIIEINDSDFQAMVDGLYHCVGWNREDQVFPTAFSLISVILCEDPKSLTLAHLPYKGVLGTKVGQIPQGAVLELCREVAGLKRTNIESFDEKTVLSLIKTCFPKPKPTKKLGSNALRHEAVTRIIKQRRRNGDL